MRRDHFDLRRLNADMALQEEDEESSRREAETVIQSRVATIIEKLVSLLTCF